jgi:hypothetical protein
MLQGVNLSRCPGPWTTEYESRYRKIGAGLDQLSALRPDGRPAALTNEAIQRLETEFQQLRLGRLLAFLRRREPDAQAGYSILIYRLTDKEVARAIFPDQR